MRVIMLGPPGSGKGTQSELIEKKYGFPKISTGDLLRREIQRGTTLGKQAEAAMNRGELVSDNLVIEMVKKRIFKPDCRRGYIMDGFPRNMNQAQMLEKVRTNHRQTVIAIHLSEQRIIERLSARRICLSCEAIYNYSIRKPRARDVCDACSGELVQRKDDTPEVIRQRLRIYNEQTKPLIDYFRKKKIYHGVNGEGSIESIFQNICSILDKDLNRSEEAVSAR